MNRCGQKQSAVPRLYSRCLITGSRFFVSFGVLLTAAIVTGFAATDSTSGYFPLWKENSPNITDLVLIYCGGEGRLAWTPDQFAPYVSYKDLQSNKESWLFDGFLFIEFRDGRGCEYTQGFGHKPARKEEWLRLLERVFEPGHGVPALEQTCAEVAGRIRLPARRRQVVLTLPEPILNQKDWGEMEGRPLDFAKADDRVAACLWYMKAAVERWKQLAPKHLDFAGFYWVAEHDANGREILPRVAQAVHAEGKRFFWIPYWKAEGAAEWRQLGFDVAYQQPNHFFHPEVSDSRLDEACAFARRYGMGMELEFDERVRTAAEKFRPRLSAYLNLFQHNEAAAKAAIAYYEGGGELLRLATSEDENLRQLYQELALWVLARQRRADELARRPASEELSERVNCRHLSR